ncbi:hypothetical protein WJX73_009376 [Symbiochloris irregularis]|uniref:DNA topoisomerase I n=1 Tax=Symbiochloris irregularis TaxID=706552 RepID=A0AAW1PDT4_9CHLO
MSSDSEDDVPLGKRAEAAAAPPHQPASGGNNIQAGSKAPAPPPAVVDVKAAAHCKAQPGAEATQLCQASSASFHRSEWRSTAKTNSPARGKACRLQPAQTHAAPRIKAPSICRPAKACPPTRAPSSKSQLSNKSSVSADQRAPAAQSAAAPAAKAAANGNATQTAPTGKPTSSAAPAANASMTDSDSDDNVPLSQRRPPVKVAPAKRPAPAATKAAPKAPPKKKARRSATPDDEDEDDSDDDSDEASEDGGRRKGPSAPKRKRATRESTGGPSKKGKGKDDSVKWTTLVHSGVLFPPEYEPHGVQMLYDGRPIDLTPEQEEVATHFAVMKETAYMEKDKFLANFWRGFRQVLGKGHAVQDLKKCDFTPIYEHLMAEREAKKNLSKEEKQRTKAEKDASEAKYKFAMVDDRKEQVGNFRVEPPGLFRGRGEHPKMGTLKRRIYPRDITINIGKEAPIPEHPFPGQKWKEVRHDNTVTWLAYWKDTVSDRDYKYVWLAANSTFKADSDLAKYEKARKLKGHIGDIRAAYEKSWESKDKRERQMGVALYFIDKLALRAGHEKEEDEADTVGCCTLKVANIECVAPDHIKFDFLGKDSMRYENETAVHPKVFELMKRFCAGKKGDDDVFDMMDATALNKHVQELMPGLSVKVFRTYNASITLDGLLYAEQADSETVEAKKVDYDRANKEVAILCNHQRSVPKGHAGQMEKLEAKTLALQEEIRELQEEVNATKKGRKSPGGKPAASVEVWQSRLDRKKEQLDKLELNQRAKEDLKTVALGTSKINYLDPRITIAWCKRMEVPIEKIFNKSLVSKFHWAMEAPPDFRF